MSTKYRGERKFCEKLAKLMRKSEGRRPKGGLKELWAWVTRVLQEIVVAKEQMT